MTSFEIWAPKGDTPLLTFDTLSGARTWVADRKHVVPGLRVFEVQITRRELIVETHQKAAA